MNICSTCNIRANTMGALCNYCYYQIPKNRELRKVRAMIYRKTNRDRIAAVHRKCILKSKYNITPEAYAELYRIQNNRCAICQKEETWTKKGDTRVLCVDHDHKTGKVRGLLCKQCNTSIGGLKDSPELLYSAFCYLQ